MFVSMWMTKELVTVPPSAPLTDVATWMSRRKIRRVPVVEPGEAARLAGIVSITDVMHAFPRSVNPLSVPANDAWALAQAEGGTPMTAADVMTRDPFTCEPEAPIEVAARLMRDRKIGALPVVRKGSLVGLITESDIFRAFVSVFEPSAAEGVRISFEITREEDVFPWLTALVKCHGMRVSSFISLPTHERPMCVVQLTGAASERLLAEIWKSRHRVVSVLHLRRD